MEEAQAIWTRTAEKISQFEADGPMARLRTWRAWKSWASTKGINPIRAEALQVQEFIMMQRKSGVHTEAMHRARWDHLKWWVVQLAAPVPLPEFIKPPKRISQGQVKDNQAAAADPEVHMQMEQALEELPAKDPHSIPLVGAMVICMSVLRFRHVQRSVLSKLTEHTLQGVCTRGKAKPGFRWAMPRFGPLGSDIGGRLWEAWKEASHKGVRRYLIFDERTKAPLSLGEFHKAVRSSLQKHAMIPNAGMYTSYSSRRCMPTIALMREASENEASALGEWQDKKDSKMPIRYAEVLERQASAAIAKLMQVELVKQVAKKARPVSWDTMRANIDSSMVEESRKVATSKFCGDTIIESTPDNMLKDIVQPERRFNLSGLAFKQLKYKRLRRQAELRAGQDRGDETQEQPAALSWCVNAYNSRQVLHIMDSDRQMPLCRANWKAGRQLAQPIAWGAKPEELRELGALCELLICTRCETRSDPVAMEQIRGIVRESAS